MNKKVIAIIIAILGISSVAFGVFYATNLDKNTETQEVPSSFTAKKNEASDDNAVETSTVISESITVEETSTEPSEAVVDANADNYRIIDNLEAIQEEIEKLNDFSNGTEDYWNGVRNSLKEKYGITVSDNTKGGFGIFDVSEGNQDSVLSAIITDIKYDKVSDKEVKFRVVTRTGRAGVVDGDVGYTAKEVREAIKKNGQDVTVDYQLNISEDGKTGELVWLAGNWW